MVSRDHRMRAAPETHGVLKHPVDTAGPVLEY